MFLSEEGGLEFGKLSFFFFFPNKWMGMTLPCPPSSQTRLNFFLGNSREGTFYLYRVRVRVHSHAMTHPMSECARSLFYSDKIGRTCLASDSLLVPLSLLLVTETTMTITGWEGRILPCRLNGGRIAGPCLASSSSFILLFPFQKREGIHCDVDDVSFCAFSIFIRL